MVRAPSSDDPIENMSATGLAEQEVVGSHNDAYQPLKFPNRSTDITSTMNNALSASTTIQPSSGLSTDGEILTVTDVARFLRVPKSTVYKLARIGELPASKIGKHWRFLRRDIHEWMHSRSQQG
jgi:excisionase family DNA binding protein